MILEIVIFTYLLLNNYYYLSFLLSISIIYKIFKFFDNRNSLRLISTNKINPKKGTNVAGGLDIPSIENCIVTRGTRKLVSSGLNIDICPSNTYLRIAPRSGLSLKCIDIGAGVIDCDYRGDIKVLVINNGDSDFEIKEGDYIAQLIIEKIKTCDILVNNYIIENKMNNRNNKGFGSSDKNS